MARGINRLPASYQKLKPGLHNDGNCLYLQVSIGPRGNRRLSWIFRYTLAGRKSRDMGLGGTSYVSLTQAREFARKYRQLVKQGIDPIAHRDAEIARNLAASAAVMTFDEAAAAYIRQHRSEWTSPLHAAQWPATLRRYASPVIGKMPVADITTAHVMKILDPIWTEKTETAKRLRGRIEAVLGWSTVSGYRQGDNPARWRDHLDNLLAAPAKVRTVKHMAALPYDQMPAFMAELRRRDGMAALALEFLALTCVRSADVLNARHVDIDLAKRIWTIPALTKTFKEHRVPLSGAAVAVVEKARQYVRDVGGGVGESDFLFCNDVTGRRLSKNAAGQLLERMGRNGQLTAHGFRASFRTWAQEQTGFAWELAELTLGHVVGSAVERAYARGDALKKRVAIMQAWSDYCGAPKGGNVVELKKSRSA
jgi:integrase